MITRLVALDTIGREWTITVRQSRGQHTLVASQVQTHGKRARAKLGFIVLGNETE